MPAANAGMASFFIVLVVNTALVHWIRQTIALRNDATEALSMKSKRGGDVVGSALVSFCILRHNTNPGEP
jgi:hypothetical protein